MPFFIIILFKVDNKRTIQNVQKLTGLKGSLLPCTHALRKMFKMDSKIQIVELMKNRKLFFLGFCLKVHTIYSQSLVLPWF